MNEAKIDLRREWRQEAQETGVRFSFPVPEDAKGFYPWGFVRKNDSAADLVGWHGIFVTLREKGEGTGQASDEDRAAPGASDEDRAASGASDEDRAAPGASDGDRAVQGVSGMVTLRARVAFAEQVPLETELAVILQGGNARAEIPFTTFPLELAKGNRWEFVTAVEIAWEGAELELVECTIRRRPGIYIRMPVRGRAGAVGERIEYRGTVYNCSSERLIVTADQMFQGWESLLAQIRLETENIILAPGESVPLLVSVTVHDYMVPGGHENTRIIVRGQGAGVSCRDSVELKTLCRLPHPYLYHDAAAWRQTAENIRRYEPYRQVCQGYQEAAEGWTVTDSLPGRDFCYETKTENQIMSTAYLYALTGEVRYAEKLADFFRRFSNPLTGYPARKRGCSQSYVQEGHFFKHLAIAYDIICDSGLLNQAEREAVEGCFRLYMEMLDAHILDGRISNWILSELQGALFCALTLQDMDRALRFAFGSGGIFEQFRYGIFNDGWWHECSVGYNTWVSSIMLHTAHALLPFGYNLVHTCFPIPFNKEVSSTYRGEAPKVDFGMYNQKWGGNRKPAVCIKDMFDATLPFLDYRGVLFGIADSDEKRLSGAHFGSTYDLAYRYYRDSRYLAVIAMNEADAIFGEPEVHALALAEEGHAEARSGESHAGICPGESLTGACPSESYAEANPTEKPSTGGETVEKVPGGKERPPMGNACADNIGLALLRSQKPGRAQREQIQAVLRYGSHGNAHGHFDITDLLSVMRYGRSFFNPENCWWGYAHFMYKFYVQCSLTKNMVVVDEKMQNPADSRRILWHSEEGLQAAGIEVRAKWSYPPYGGMVYTQDGQTATKEELRRRCKMNGCFLPIVEGEGSPGYGDLTGFTEPILQRRVMAVTDDYIVLFDYVEGEREHVYDSLMQIKGFLGISGKQVKKIRHTEQMDSNPISDAQFITDCDWYEVKGGSVARFRTVFTEEHAGERLICERSNYNEPGILNMDIHTAWPGETEQMVGRVAVYDGWAADGDGYTIPLSYRVELDGATAEEEAFDGWILGRGEVSLDMAGASQAVLSLKQGAMHNEIGEPVRTPQGVFWGEICLELEDGSIIDLGQCMKEAWNPDQDTERTGEPGFGQGGVLQDCVAKYDGTQDCDARCGRTQGGAPQECDAQSSAGQDYRADSRWIAQRVSMENVDSGWGIGRDYKGGRVTIVGTEYPYAVGASPIDHGRESRIILDLEGLHAVRLTACVGVDAFAGDEWQRRKTYAVRSRGRTGRFLTVIEPYESESVIDRVEAEGPDCVKVWLKDGQVQTVSLTGMEEGRPKVGMRRS